MKNNMINSLMRKDIIALNGYSKNIPVEIKKFIKLDAGENPYTSLVFKNERVGIIPFFSYPDPNSTKLRQKISDYLQVSNTSILCGNGSDELIDLIIRLFIEKGDEVILTPPTFSVYELCATLAGAHIIKIQRSKDLSIDTKKIKRKINKNTKIIFIDSPGNPTCVTTSIEQIEELLKTNKIIVVDEAYAEYSGKTVLPLLQKYKNLIILRTFSKWAGLAGVRIGYMLADPIIIKSLTRIKLPYSVNGVGQYLAGKALDKKDELFNRLREQKMIRDKTIKRLKKIVDVFVFPSESAYILIQIRNANQLNKYNLEKNILIKDVSQPGLQNTLRISIGTEKEMEIFVQTIRRFYANR